MGMILFILGVVLVVGGLAVGLPLMWREAIGTGAAVAIMVGSGVVGLGSAIAGLMMGKSKAAPQPAPAPLPVMAPPPPPPPPQPQGIQCPGCQRRLPLGVNRCPFCHPPEPAAPPPPAPPPPPQSVEAGPATKGRGAIVGPNGYLQVLEGPAAGKQFAIKPNIQITIGRGDHNLLVVGDPEVSSSHCVLTCGNDRILFKDLGSSNGSFLNDQPIREGRIMSGDTLRLGRTTKIFFSFK